MIFDKNFNSEYTFFNEKYIILVTQPPNLETKRIAEQREIFDNLSKWVDGCSENHLVLKDD